MSRIGVVMLLAMFAVPLQARAEPNWTEGVQFSRVQPSQPTGLPAGTVEVTEVFSYACPYCNQFQPTMHALIASLPANVRVNYLPASFSPAEDFPMFQRAYYTALALGVAAKNHDAMFDAVWKSGELAVVNLRTDRLKNPLPSINDVARFYQRRAHIPISRFLATAQSFWVDLQIKNCDRLVKDYQVPGTPCIIVNGKYRVNMDAVGNNPKELIELVNWLVKQESQ
ncbi:MAG: thiol:disulfide interchange protein DsbA/DsbL [Steroidobacteraceae bacterium]